MAITQKSRWDDVGQEPPAGDAKYVAGEQPIAEYDNWFNYSVAQDIAALNAWLDNLGITKVYIDTSANKPDSGQTTELYIETDTNRIFRGTGSGWQELAIDLSQIIVDTDFLPDADGTRDLGSSTKRWKRGYFSEDIFGTRLYMKHSDDLDGSKFFYSPATLTADRTLFGVGDDSKTPIYLIWWVRRADGSDDFYLGTEWGEIKARSDILPDTDNYFNLGSSTNRWNWIWGTTIVCQDGTLIMQKPSSEVHIAIELRETTDPYHRWAIIKRGATSESGEADGLVFSYHDGSSWYSWLILDVLTSSVKLKNSFVPYTDNAFDLGNSTLRWANLYAVNVVQGDSIFANDWRITEKDDNGEMIDGLIFRNPQGEEVLRITNEGLFFKGQKLN